MRGQVSPCSPKLLFQRLRQFLFEKSMWEDPGNLFRGASRGSKNDTPWGCRWNSGMAFVMLVDHVHECPESLVDGPLIWKHRRHVTFLCRRVQRIWNRDRQEVR